METISNTEPHWYAVKTNYRSEKFVTAHLLERGVDAYVPLREVVKKYDSRIKRYKIPLLNCYVFVHIVQKDYLKVLDTPNVYGFIRFGRELIPVKDEEIDILKAVIGERFPTTLSPHKLLIGQEVEIASGFLIGIKGKITGRINKFFTIELDSIGYDIYIDPKYLQLS